ncbi:STAS domain-containing protein [soil metagenome]
MDFEVSIVEHVDSYSVIAVRGEVDIHTAPKVQYAIDRGSNGAGAVVVDMNGITFMDSTALSMFMRAKDSLEEQGVTLRLAAPSDAVDRIFGVTGCGEYFEIYPSPTDAISN